MTIVFNGSGVIRNISASDGSIPRLNKAFDSIDVFILEGCQSSEISKTWFLEHIIKYHWLR